MDNLNNITKNSKDLSKEASSMGNNIREKAQDMGDNIKDKATDLGQKAVEKTHEVKEQLCGYIKEHPYKSVGIAFLAGAILSRIRNARVD